MTLDDKWKSLTIDAGNGHLTWNGPRSMSGSPVFWVGVRSHSARRVAFTIHSGGRQPVGQVRAECGLKECTAPSHVEDAAGRARIRGQLRAIRGLVTLPDTCGAGHERAVHGRFEPGGKPYCNRCLDEAREARRTAAGTRIGSQL